MGNRTPSEGISHLTTEVLFVKFFLALPEVEVPLAAGLVAVQHSKRLDHLHWLAVPTFSPKNSDWAWIVASMILSNYLNARLLSLAVKQML